MQAIINSGDLVPIQNPQGNQVAANADDSYVIRIEMIDGTSQLVHLSVDQAVALGLQCPTVEAKPVKQTTSTFLNYKVIQPSELNLCAVEPNKHVTPAVPRGRPRKRPTNELVVANVKPASPPKVKIIKTSRTRSGRITRPPVHMERDFEKIVTDVKPKLHMSKDLDTVQFEPLNTTNNTNNTKEEPTLISLDTNPRKRLIPAQYRCTTCKKAYLGRNKMARHLKKYPSHGSSSHLNMEDGETWSCLIETALRANKGQRGSKFCKEIISLIQHARILVKYFFKPAKLGQCEYIVDETLAEVLNIKPGDYRFNENKLCKDVNIFSYLFNDDSFMDMGTGNDETVHDLEADFDVKIPATITGNEENATNSLEDSKTKPVVDLHFESELVDVISLPETSKKAEEESEMFNIQDKSVTDTSQHKEIGKSDFMHIFNEDFIDKGDKEHKDKTYDLYSSNFYIESKDKKSFEANSVDGHGKEVDIFRNTINNILNFGASDEHMSSLLDKEKKARKSDEFDLNKLHLDELLSDTPVNNLLDTSTGSDDIMNVDQFVNERFKKLTETEGDMPNLELPALECFNFNS